jgi:hypothetical protein
MSSALFGALSSCRPVESSLEMEMLVTLALASPMRKFATNQLDMDYLKYGPDSVLRHMQWVERLEGIRKKKLLVGWMKYFKIPADWLHLALNHAPPPLTCTLFSALKSDLTSAASQHAPGTDHSYTNAYSGAHLKSLSKKGGTCDQILEKMHAAKALFEEFFVDPAAQGGRGLAFCQH